MAHIKTNENTFGVLDQERADAVSSVTSKACDVVKSRQSIFDPMAKT